MSPPDAAMSTARTTGSDSGKTPSESPPLIVELDEVECREIIVRQRMCVVAMVDADVPYAVPVYYGFDGAALYLGVAEGRKTRVLDDNPRVHVIITEPGEGDSWRSVAIAGRAIVLTEPAERAQGIAALIAHNRRPERSAGAGEHAPTRPRTGGRVIRIDDPVITGRARR
ncbi:MAG TPA: pyridoxamine 5'-phosphate oxidase family protein [Gemmatimonadaceae bacterium]|nr:pyridoxamine 5'-phosphate oxidase family protein [Gemmatimonadaceae bacterium]